MTTGRESALGAMSFGLDLDELADREFVIEAVVESEPAKLEVFGQLSKVLDRPGRP